MNEGGTAEAFEAFAPYWGGGFFCFCRAMRRQCAARHQNASENWYLPEYLE
jgi:hypothetical protein